MKLFAERSGSSLHIDNQSHARPEGARTRRMRRLRFWGMAAMMLPGAAEAQVCTSMPTIDVNRSLVVTDSALDKDKFSFVATIDAILESLNIAPDATGRENLVNSLVVSFNAQQFNNPDSGLPTPVDVRPLEAALDPKKLLDPLEDTGLVPVALFNRFDLAPADMSNCGEHRIVYSFKAPIANPPGRPSRFFLIFEARLDNPQPELGFEGCRPVADFWWSLSDEEDAPTRALQLAQFYYDGIPGSAGPVVQAGNYGGPLGQVRGNLFINSAETSQNWQLREWIVINAGGTTPASFLPVTVKGNPLAEFYQDANDNSLNQVLEALERARFQQEFTDRHIRELIDPELTLPTIPAGDERYDARLDTTSPDFDAEWYEIAVLSGIGARFDNRTNEFQSVSQGNEDDPMTLSHLKGGLFLNQAAVSLDDTTVQNDRKPSIDDVVTRAGAITCGGCHQFSEDLPVGSLTRRIGGESVRQSIDWPQSAGFVHVTEPVSGGAADLSPALLDVFLPFRAHALCKAVTSEPEAVVALSPAVTATSRAETSELAQLAEQLAVANEEGTQAEQGALAARLVERTLSLREDEIQKPGFFVTNRRPH